MTTVELPQNAIEYRNAELSVLPADPVEKRPLLQRWKEYQHRLPSEEEIRHHPDEWSSGLCIVCGAVSGNLEMMDFDFRGELYAPWREKVEARAPGLANRLVVESTQSSGWHVIYRCEGKVCGNLKLAQRRRPVTEEEISRDEGGVECVYLRGKKYVVRVDEEGARHVLITLIETRGEGGLFLCAPTPGYELAQGELTDVPELTDEERETLLWAAWELNEYLPPAMDGPPGRTKTSAGGSSKRPGDDFNARGDIRPLLETHGWRLVRGGENEYWRRPGKDRGTSATFNGSVFYCFSTNAPPFEGERAYSRFSVYALLEHGGDYGAAASALRRQGYGDEIPEPADMGVDLSQFMLPSVEAQDPPGEVRCAGRTMRSLGELLDESTELRRPVIERLLREGETMNVIAPPKAGKSWLVVDLALSVASGRRWLGEFETARGNVLILDNELHAETSANRVPKVAAARDIPLEEVQDTLYVDNMRGRLTDIFGLGRYFGTIEPGCFKVIVLDAFYRFIPQGTEENDNGAMAAVYNQIDRYADRLNCCFILIHHTTKGNQSGKSVTDVGAGAGSQSRAADSHLILRPHREDDAVVLEAAVRSWPPLPPRVLRWEFPVWQGDETLDPAALRTQGRRKRKPEETPASERWDYTRFAEELVGEEPAPKACIIQEAEEAGLSNNRAEKLLRRAEGYGLVHRWRGEGRQPISFATVPQPVDPGEEHSDADADKRAAIEWELARSPEASNREVARRLDTTHSYVARVRREVDPEGPSRVDPGP